jgi:hypothetical protein
MDPAADRARRVWGRVAVVVLFVLALAVYLGLLLHGSRRENIPSDLYLHIGYTMRMTTQPLNMPHRLFHYALALMLALSPAQGWVAAKWCAALVLAGAVALRGWLSYRELVPALRPAAAAAACLALALAMALPKWWDFPAVYLGQVNANVWHNPTAVFAAPLALLVFLEAMRYWDSPSRQRALSLGVWSALCALAKPNYLLAFFPCFVPVFLAVTLREVRRGRLPVGGALACLLGAFAPPAVALGWSFWFMYGTGDPAAPVDQAGLVVAPLEVWSTWTPAAYMPAAVFGGLAFPVVTTALFPRRALADRRFLFCWPVMALSVAQFALLAESGPRFEAGNWGWAMVPSAYILFLESCRLAGARPAGARAWLAFFVLGLHAASGAVYLARSLANPFDCVGF